MWIMIGVHEQNPPAGSCRGVQRMLVRRTVLVLVVAATHRRDAVPRVDFESKA
jgi:hypothetical protein